MVIVRLMGGLGNQLFQYAMARALTLRLDAELAFDLVHFESDDLRSYALDAFGVAGRPATPDELAPYRGARGLYARLMPRRWTPNAQLIGERRHWNYDPGWLPTGGGAYLEGLWQTERYFEDASDVVRRDLTYVRPLSAADRTRVREMAERPSVSVHVRRTDYLDAQDRYGAFDPDYYAAAARRMLEVDPDVHFHVFSDDPLWVAEHLHLPGPTTVVSDGVRDAAADLRLMAACRHHIVTNSTFSWWGAWIGRHPRGVTIGPRRWVVVDEPHPDVVPTWWETL